MGFQEDREKFFLTRIKAYIYFFLIGMWGIDFLDTIYLLREENKRKECSRRKNGLHLSSMICMNESYEKAGDYATLGWLNFLNFLIPSLWCRVFHQDSKNGLLSVLRWIPNLHCLLDDKPVFWPFLALWALAHFFRLATWNWKQNTSFGFKVLSENCFVRP